MGLKSYKLFRDLTHSNPHKELLHQKKMQIECLYVLAPDREENVLLNEKEFVKSPRIFDRKFVDSIHHKITVETIDKDDWIECGDYLTFDNMVWLCLNSYSFHGLYCRATFMSCDWKLYWQDKSGIIKNIYVIDQNSTQYNSGESGNSTITLGAAQHMLKMQCTDDTVMFDSPMRFAIDRNIQRPTCYKVTQNDNSAYNYGKGLCCITVVEVAKNSLTDKRITLEDGSQAWICDYHSPTTEPAPPDETINLSVSISGGDTLMCGFPNTWTVSFKDKEGLDVADNAFEWNIVSNFKIAQTIDGNKIRLNVSDDSLIGESFLLQISTEGAVLAELDISIVGIF